MYVVAKPISENAYCNWWLTISLILLWNPVSDKTFAFEADGQSYSQGKTGVCAWHARAIPNDFWGNENIRLSYGLDNLERADLKINLKSLYIICKKLLSISYQHDAAPVCGHCRKFLTAVRDILSQSDLLSDFSQLGTLAKSRWPY